jgi:hypothetical protein
MKKRDIEQNCQYMYVMNSFGGFTNSVILQHDGCNVNLPSEAEDGGYIRTRAGALELGLRT